MPPNKKEKQKGAPADNEKINDRDGENSPSKMPPGSRKKIRLMVRKDFPKNIKKNFKIPKGGFWANVLSIVVIFLLLMAISGVFSSSATLQKISLSELAREIETGNVISVSVKGNEVTAQFADGTSKVTTKEPSAALLETLADYGVSKEKLLAVELEIKGESGFWFWFANILPIALPIIFIVFFFWYLSRQAKAGGMQAFTFGQSKPKIIAPNDTKQRVLFKDVAGAKEAKQELSEIVDFLRHPKKFLDIGAQIPKGVILMGAPGTGKTLLARAVAGEANVAFFSISGSEFVEMFVGVGASRVRDLFQMAKRAAPAIVFVDEIDAVGRARGQGLGGGNDEREQTLNQILVEMDGFEPNEKVIVMAATNRPDVLDPALLRPGRFDRRVIIDLPDRHDREDILKIHSRTKPFAEDVNLGVVAERTPGFSGADLYSLMNEAAILAAREDRSKVSQYDLIRSIEKVMLGPERKSHLLSKKEKEITAYHEAGHAIVSSVLLYADPVHKISIIARGHAGGYTLKLPLEDRRLQSRREFLDDIATGLGGYVAEKMIFGDITTGPSNDLQVSSAIARDMVTKYGMSEKVGAQALEPSKMLLGRGVEEEYSERVASLVDSEVDAIMRDALKQAEKVLKKHSKLLAAVAKRLMDEETIEREEFEKMLVAHGIPLKKKKDIEHQA